MLVISDVGVFNGVLSKAVIVINQCLQTGLNTLHQSVFTLTVMNHLSDDPFFYSE